MKMYLYSSFMSVGKMSATAVPLWFRVSYREFTKIINLLNEPISLISSFRLLDALNNTHLAP